MFKGLLTFMIFKFLEVYFLFNIDFFYKQTIPIDKNCDLSRSWKLKGWLKIENLKH